MSYDKADLKRRMEGALDSLKSDFSGLRTGRASTAMLDPVIVNVYGSQMPLNQVGTVSTPEARLLTVSVWDQGNVAAVEKAIRDSGLGLNPNTEGSLIRLPVPALNEERRTEMTKVASKYAEQARIAIRNVRRDGMDALKQLEKDGDMSEDEAAREEKEVQKLTDDFVTKVDETLAHKEAEIMEV